MNARGVLFLQWVIAALLCEGGVGRSGKIAEIADVVLAGLCIPAVHKLHVPIDERNTCKHIGIRAGRTIHLVRLSSDILARVSRGEKVAILKSATGGMPEGAIAIIN